MTGATVRGNTLSFKGALAGAQPPDVTIAATDDSPGGGYLPLSLFGGSIVVSAGDETITNFNVPAFVYGGETYSRIGIVSNGYLVVGGGTGADVNYLNQSLPDATPPNNVLAPFWTDLNPGAGGQVLINVLSDGTNSWIVVDYEDVKNYSSAQTNSFQVWIGINGTQDITYAYGPVTTGDGGFLTIGAENKFGNRGQNYYYDGTGTLPGVDGMVRVSASAPAPGGTQVITFKAKADKKGPWTNCAELTQRPVPGGERRLLQRDGKPVMEERRGGEAAAAAGGSRDVRRWRTSLLPFYCGGWTTAGAQGPRSRWQPQASSPLHSREQKSRRGRLRSELGAFAGGWGAGRSGGGRFAEEGGTAAAAVVFKGAPLRLENDAHAVLLHLLVAHVGSWAAEAAIGPDDGLRAHERDGIRGDAQARRQIQQRLLDQRVIDSFPSFHRTLLCDHGLNAERQGCERAEFSARRRGRSGAAPRCNGPAGS